jgi:1-acyl-sn-glycerol-3-phosphate acyltransferase
MSGVLSRRTITIPAIVLACFLSLALFPLILLGAVVLDLALSRKNLATTRIALFLPCYLLVECAGLLMLFSIFIACMKRNAALQSATYSVQRWYTGTLFRVVSFLFQVTHTTVNSELAQAGPAVFLVRHASLIDVLIPGVFIANAHKIRLRYVLKSELLSVPCLDVAGHFIPNYFATRKSADTVQALESIRKLKHNLSANEGVLIYPEGTRFSQEKREKLLAEGSADSQKRARELTHVLPIKNGGTGVLLSESPSCDVVIVGHKGLENLTTLTDIWRGNLVKQHIEVKFWRFDKSQIPTESTAQTQWIHEQWKQMDVWLGP